MSTANRTATSLPARSPLRFAAVAVVLAFAAWTAVALAFGGAWANGGDALTIALLLVGAALPVWSCIRRDGGGIASVDLLQPGVVLVFVFYFYTIIPALHVWLDLDYTSVWVDPTWPATGVYHSALLLCLMGLGAFGVGYRLRSHRPQWPVTARTSHPVEGAWPAAATILAVVLLGIGSVFYLYHLSVLGGLNRNLLLFLSPTYEKQSGVTFGGVPMFLGGFFDWGVLLLEFRAIYTRRDKLATVMVVGVALFLGYLLTGKRSAIAPFLFFPLIWHHYLHRRLSLRRAAQWVSVGVVLMIALLAARTVGPLFATKGFKLSMAPADILEQPLRFFVNSPDLNVFDMTMMSVEDRDQILHEIGGRVSGAAKYNLVPAVFLIPRALWPSKPVYSNIGVVYYQRATNDAENVGFTVGSVGVLYLFAGVPGVVLGMMLIGALFHFTYRWLRPWTLDLRRLFLYAIAVWMAFHFLRFGDLGGTTVYFYQFQLVGVIVAFVAFRGGQPAPLAPSRDTAQV